MSHVSLPLEAGLAENASSHAKGVPKPLSAQILTPHTCLEGSAPDLEEEDITEQEATYIPKSPGEEINGSPFTFVELPTSQISGSLLVGNGARGILEVGFEPQGGHF